MFVGYFKHLTHLKPYGKVEVHQNLVLRPNCVQVRRGGG
jgi:hypothetical protein